MTRFARSKGSKSSNERLPNEATPWHVMKEQLGSVTEKEQEPQSRPKSAKQLLEEKDLYYPKELAKLKLDWAEFENSSNKSDPTNTREDKNLKKQSTDKNVEGKVTESASTIKHSQSKNVKEKRLKRKNGNVSVNSNANEPKNKKQKVKAKDSLEHENQRIDNTSKRKEKTNVKCTGLESDTPKFPDGDTKNDGEKCVIKKDVLSKRQKRNQKLQQKNNDANKGTDGNNRLNINKNRKFNGSFNNNNIPRKYQKKTAKIRDNKFHSRRKPDEGSVKVTINGVDLEIVKYDGFPIIKKDAERLIDLRKQMVIKGISKAEIDVAMKLERRKCEKALARIRRQVCFHCRKAGHNLSDCPELEKEEIMTGICFKCGSTEHTHFECKVNKADDFKFAKCFICREQGHIAKQCPDNPKGLYPDGGSCKICGDVTHLKKDCPDLFKQKEESTITVDTIGNKNLESLGDEFNNVNLEVKPTKKIVKF